MRRNTVPGRQMGLPPAVRMGLERCLPALLVVVAVSCGREPGPQAGKAGTDGQRTITINNVEPRRDVTGAIVDAHDGCLQYFGGRYYLYGTAYGTSDRLSSTNRYRVYSSPDLARWTYEGELLRGQPAGVYYRPYVVFNPKTHQYVLWYNWYPELWDGQTGVAVSETPVGPFTIVNTNVKLSRLHPGDGSLFVDEDGTGYFIYTAIDEGYAIRVERLTPDFLGSTGERSDILAIGTEAPVLFRRFDLYYALCGPKCLACRGGSEVQVFTSGAPLGPFVTKPGANINRFPENYVPTVTAQGNGSVRVPTPAGMYQYRPETNVVSIGAKNTPYITAQETWVAKIPASQGVLYIWMADRWSSDPGEINGHDFQYWAPLEFDSHGDILPIRALKRWQLSPIP